MPKDFLNPLGLSQMAFAGHIGVPFERITKSYGENRVSRLKLPGYCRGFWDYPGILVEPANPVQLRAPSPKAAGGANCAAGLIFQETEQCFISPCQEPNTRIKRGRLGAPYGPLIPNETALDQGGFVFGHAENGLGKSVKVDLGILQAKSGSLPTNTPLCLGMDGRRWADLTDFMLAPGEVHFAEPHAADFP